MDFSRFRGEGSRGVPWCIGKWNEHSGRKVLGGADQDELRVGIRAFLILEGLSLVRVGASSFPTSSRRKRLYGLPIHQALFLTSQPWEQVCLDLGHGTQKDCVMISQQAGRLLVKLTYTCKKFSIEKRFKKAGYDKSTSEHKDLGYFCLSNNRKHACD